MKALWLMVLWAVTPAVLVAEVRTYRHAPSGEALSLDYKVLADGKEVDVYTARVLDPPFAGRGYDYGGPYAFANFDMKGAVKVRITAKRSLRNTVIRPVRPGIKTALEDDHTLLLTLAGPAKLSIEPDGKKGPLLLFANPIEQDVPKLEGKGVVFFGPGMHRVDRILLTNDQTLYLAGGAVVKGGIVAQGENIRICGRGILDSSDWAWLKGPTPQVVSVRGTNVEVSGITIRGASRWTIALVNSRKITIRNIKLCNSRVQNDDGIDPCNSRDVLISDCFIRSDDDCVALKGLDLSAPNSNVERIRVENCILWCDRARIFLLGHESRARFMRQITLRNLDIIHFSMTPFLLEPGEEMRLEDVKVEDVRIHAEGQPELIRLRPVVNQYMLNKVPGHIQRVQFRNVLVSGAPGACRIQIDGPDPQHEVRGVEVDRLVVGDEAVSLSSERVQIGKHAEEIVFNPGKGHGTAEAADFNVLVFSKTLMFRHPSITNGIAAIKKLGAENRFKVDATEDSAAFTASNLARYKVIIFLSTSGDVLNDEQQAAFKAFIEKGGGLAAIHAGVAGDVATEGGWPWYGEALCARFTNHSAIVQAAIDVEDRTNPSTTPLPARWMRTDEWYNFISSPRGKAQVLASLDETTYPGGTMGKDHPIAWCRKMGKGGIWYTALGHTEESFSEPLFLQHLLGGIRFAAGVKR